MNRQIVMDSTPIGGTTLRHLILLTAASLLLSSAAVGASGIPDIIESRADQAVPYWVALDVAVDPNGELNEDIYPLGPRITFKNRITFTAERLTPVDGCRQLGRVPNPDSALKPGTLSAATREADRIARFLVTGSEVGLADIGNPGTLFRAELVEQIHGKLLDHNVYFFAFPVAELKIGGNLYCKTDERYPRLPEVGEEVVLLIDELDLWVNQYIRLASEPQVIIFGHDDTIELAPQFRDETLTIPSIDELMTQLRSFLLEDSSSGNQR
ncbi:MAG: hypothetical protein AAGD38_11760 [Acidobacteriota bacterium]